MAKNLADTLSQLRDNMMNSATMIGELLTQLAAAGLAPSQNTEQPSAQFTPRNGRRVRGAGESAPVIARQPAPQRRVQRGSQPTGADGIPNAPTDYDAFKRRHPEWFTDAGRLTAAGIQRLRWFFAKGLEINPAARQMGMAYRSVQLQHAAWEKDGRPYPEGFDNPPQTANAETQPETPATDAATTDAEFENANPNKGGPVVAGDATIGADATLIKGADSMPTVKAEPEVEAKPEVKPEPAKAPTKAASTPKGGQRKRGSGPTQKAA